MACVKLSRCFAMLRSGARNIRESRWRGAFPQDVAALARVKCIHFLLDFWSGLVFSSEDGVFPWTF